MSLNTKTLEFIKKNMEPELYDMLTEQLKSPDQSKKSEAQLICEAAEESPNPKLKLYCLLLQRGGGKDYYLSVARQAAAFHDYVTALYWHKHISLEAIDIEDQFERTQYIILAERQRKEDPTAQPIKSAEQMTAYKTETAKALRDPSYEGVQYAYRKVEKEAYQKGFDTSEESAFMPLLRKIDKSSNVGCVFGLIIIALAFWWLYFSVPKVWGWADVVFNRMAIRFFVMDLFTWIVPILYIIAIVVIGFLLLCLCFKSSTDLEEKLKKRMEERRKSIYRDILMTEEYKCYAAMNECIPQSFHSYEKRLVLASLSDMYGEEDRSKLSKLWRKTEHSTWLIRAAGNKDTGKKPHNKTIYSMLKNPSHVSDVLIAVVLCVQEIQQNSTENSSDRRIKAHTLSGMNRVRSYVISSKEAEAILFEFIINFLLSHYERAESENDYELLGEACYLLYSYGDYDIAYTYGTKGYPYSKKLRLAVMECASWNDSSPRSLGYNRNDAKAYIRELNNMGDPDGKKLQATLDSAIQSEIQRARDAAELREMERDNARKQAELRRERLRSELNDKADEIERTANLIFTNDYSTDFEKNLSGGMSDTDYDKSRYLRDKAIEKKLDELDD